MAVSWLETRPPLNNRQSRDVTSLFWHPSISRGCKTASPRRLWSCNKQLYSIWSLKECGFLLFFVFFAICIIQVFWVKRNMENYSETEWTKGKIVSQTYDNRGRWAQQKAKTNEFMGKQNEQTQQKPLDRRERESGREKGTQCGMCPGARQPGEACPTDVYSPPSVSLGDWFQDPRGYQNRLVLKSLV